ncbi:hypothetical protein V6N13_103076 [Hibiscus sabdariffa]|uniref:Uncharacterized protein n=1 Tax=Hibiscus sabdariffa TaxID=183260 RepID=A0ABR2C5X5_9ROSI
MEKFINFMDELEVNIMFSFPKKLNFVLYELLQASSDTSILDSDISFVLVFVAAGATEVMATTGSMEFITRYVLIIAVFATVMVK